jgi:hypothetical protein
MALSAYVHLHVCYMFITCTSPTVYVRGHSVDVEWFLCPVAIHSDDYSTDSKLSYLAPINATSNVFRLKLRACCVFFSGLYTWFVVFVNIGLYSTQVSRSSICIQLLITCDSYLRWIGILFFSARCEGLAHTALVDFFISQDCFWYYGFRRFWKKISTFTRLSEASAYEG